MTQQNHSKRIQHEIDHGKKIQEHAEDIWGWSTPAGLIRANRRAEYFIKLGNITPTDKILEIGCGTALFTEKVYNSVQANITAIDISGDLLDKARTKLPQVNFMNEDAMHLSFSDNSFDFVYGSSVLHHLEVEKALKECFRVLKPGKALVFAEPNMLNPQIFIQKNIPFIKRIMGDSPDETAFIRWKLKNVLKNVGFKDIKIFPYDFLHPSVSESLIGIVKSIGFVTEKTPLLREIAGSLIIYAKK